MDRHHFILNPTNCEAMSVAGSLTSTVGKTAPLSNRFRLGGCRKLEFAPKLSLKLLGSTKRAGNPALHAHLTMAGMGAAGANEAGLAYSQVALPNTEFLDNAHIGTLCTRVVFKEGAVEGEKCPPGSVIGHAKAVTPILSEPLEGPIYLRANPERNLPDIAAALHGSEISVVAVGHTDSAPGGGLRNTFEVIPDAPITSVDIDLFGGKRGLLENAPKGNANTICAKRQLATVKFTGHNGKRYDHKISIVASGCGKRKKPKRSAKHRRAAR
jgi:hypothetical protein